MKRIEINFQSENDMQQQFEKVTEQLFSKYVLVVNDAVYRLVDIEYYAYAGVFEDPYTHKNHQQLSNGKFYLHGSGMDITFGDGYNYGGILIRGIVKMKKQEHTNHYVPEMYIDGPWLSSSEIISQLYPITQEETSNTISLSQTETDLFHPSILKPLHVFFTKRIGLGVKNEPKAEGFRNMPLRHVALLENEGSFKHKITGISNLTDDAVKKGLLSVENEEKILGYKRKR